jgi:4-alpha-glucanotransferase
MNFAPGGTGPRALIADALALVGTRRLALAIHDPSFPAHADEDTGLGTPYAAASHQLCGTLAQLGFTALQLGPQGQTSPHNPSPYDGTIFARNAASLALRPLARRYPWLLPEAVVDSVLVAAAGDRADHGAGHGAVESALETIFERFDQQVASGDDEARALAVEVGRFRSRNGDWLRRTALFDVEAERHDSGRPDDWSDPIDRLLWRSNARARRRRQSLELSHGARIDDLALLQLLLHQQHRQLRDRCGQLGLEIYGDLQIGIPPREAWAYRELLLDGYRMGAPPSRTNPEGQPWGYPLLDPGQCGAVGPARAFVKARARRLFEGYDALRIDHPHGWICPWAYRVDGPHGADPLAAVQGGARLYSSPDLGHEHPALAPFAIVPPEQLDRGLPRYHEAAVQALTGEQIARYATLFDVLVDAAGDPRRLICEVLSTQPHPMGEVLRRHGLGRFRVTQKANLDDPRDVYRTENAKPADWVMVGTHDTPTIWDCVGSWRRDGSLTAQACHLARRLTPEGRDPTELEASLAASPQRVAQGKLAELFACEAESAMVFFADLIGETRRYNTPGTVGDHNWTLRLPRRWLDDYRDAVEVGAAMSVPGALALALRARGGDDREALAGKLDQLKVV